MSLVPDGVLITPPSKNEYDLDAFERMSREERGGADAFASQRATFERLFRDGMPPMKP